MRCILLVTVLVTWAQYVASKEIPYHNSVNALVSKQSVNDLRSIKEISANIRNSIKIALSSIKNIANNTKEKIQDWAQNVEDRASEIAKEFEDQQKNLQENSKSIIEDIVGTRKLVKDCLKKDKEVITKILGQILKQFGTCVSGNILKLKHLKDGRQSNLDIYVDKISVNVEEKLNTCMEEDKISNSEECLHNVRKETFAEMETMEDDILRTRMESRSLADGILGALISCSVKGLMASSVAIAKESLKIIKCVKESGLL